MFGEKFDLEFYLDKNEKWNQPCENMKTEHEIYRYSPPKSFKKAKVLGFTLQFFSNPASPGPKKILSRLFCTISVPSWPAMADSGFHEWRTFTNRGPNSRGFEKTGLKKRSWKNGIFEIS